MVGAGFQGNGRHVSKLDELASTRSKLGLKQGLARDCLGLVAIGRVEVLGSMQGVLIMAQVGLRAVSSRKPLLEPRKGVQGSPIMLIRDY